MSDAISPSRPLLDRLNSEWHKYALWAYSAVVLAHWGEHLAQAFQIYALGWPLKEARGVLGLPFPWLVKSEVMHYGYALVMLVCFWVFRSGFVGRSHRWWMAAFYIQCWHHFEHLLLQGQALLGVNFFGAPAPISVIQMIGFLDGSPESGFGGLMMGPPVHPLSFLMFIVRRVEVHMLYNTIVFVPMVIAMYYHLYPTKEERSQMRCSCALGHAGHNEPKAQAHAA